MARVKGWPFAIVVFIAVALNVMVTLGGSYVGPNSWWFARLFAPVPYKDVQVIESVIHGRQLHYTATFIKVQCEQRHFIVVGHFLGQTEVLRYRDLDGFPANYDRTPGRNTLRIMVELRRDYDRIEMRTRHFCADHTDENADEEAEGIRGVTVDRVFDVFDPDIEVTPDHPRSGHSNYIGPVGGY